MSWPITISPPSRTANRETVTNAVHAMLGDTDITGKHVTVDWSDCDAITPSAADETLLAITDHGDPAALTVLVGAVGAVEMLDRIVKTRELDNVTVLFVGSDDPGDPLDRPVTAKDLWDVVEAMNEAGLALEQARMDMLTQILCRVANIETAIRGTRQ